MTAEVTVIDYGVGNLYSVQRGLEHCGAKVTVTSDHQAILASPKIVLPGVGAFGNAMAELRNQQLVPVLHEVARLGKPLLGICLGMQMLFDESNEFGRSEGLGLISGRVVPVPDTLASGEQLKVPHIGWQGLVPSDGQVWDGTILQGLRPGEAAYFVHSYMAAVEDKRQLLAECIYGGHRVAAVVARGNVFGCQFHPEKSGEVGLRILRAFCEL